MIYSQAGGWRNKNLLFREAGALLLLASVQPMQQQLKLWLRSGAQGPEIMETL